jgi:hypothetical protein
MIEVVIQVLVAILA